MLTSGKRKLLLTTIHFFYWDFFVWSRAVWKPLSFHSTGNASETRWTLLKHDEIRFHPHIWLPIINNSFHFSPHKLGPRKQASPHKPAWRRKRKKCGTTVAEATLQKKIFHGECYPLLWNPNRNSLALSWADS